MLLPGVSGTGPSIALQRLRGDAAGLWLEPRVQDDRLASTRRLTPTRWSREDLVAAADWFRLVADGVQPVSRHLWFAEPAVAFGVVEMTDAHAALDVCLLHDVEVLRPTLTGAGCHPSQGDDRFEYLTVDVVREAVAHAARTWSRWAEALRA